MEKRATRVRTGWRVEVRGSKVYPWSVLGPGAAFRLRHGGGSDSLSENSARSTRLFLGSSRRYSACRLFSDDEQTRGRCEVLEDMQAPGCGLVGDCATVRACAGPGK